MRPNHIGSGQGKSVRTDAIYKFLLDGERWLVDPANPSRATDDTGNWNSVIDYLPEV